MKRKISGEFVKNEMIKKNWNSLKRKTSILLIVCLIISSIVPANSVYAKDTAYKLIDELEITDDSYFDENGKMLTGWVGTSDGKWYFFEDRKIMDEGKMIYGWRSIQGAWYYFGIDGAMLTNTITPDGYTVGADGKCIQ